MTERTAIRIVVVGAVLAVSACQFRTSTMRVRGSVVPPRIQSLSLLLPKKPSTLETEFAQSAARGAKQGGLITVSSQTTDVELGGEALPQERACRTALALRHSGHAVDAVAVIAVSQGGESEQVCTKTKVHNDWSNIIDPDKKVSSTGCAAYEYRGSRWTTTAVIELFDARTCLPLGKRSVSSYGFKKTDDRHSDLLGAARQSNERFGSVAERWPDNLFPNGLALERQQGRTSVVTRYRGDPLEAGKTLWYGTGARKSRVRVTSLDSTHAVLETEDAGSYLRAGDYGKPGDTLSELVGVHEWSIYPTVQVSRLSADGAARTNAGASVEGRWTRRGSRWFIKAGIGNLGGISGDVSRTSIVGGSGLAWQLGRFAPFALAELGLVISAQDDVMDQTARRSGLTVGAGAGVSVRLGSFFVVGDFQYRGSFLFGSWKSESDPDTDVALPLDSFQDTTVRIGFGFAFSSLTVR